MGTTVHEYSIILALLDQVRSQAEAHGAASVDRVRVRVGEQAGVEIELLRTAYELARHGTICAGAELELATSPAIWECPQCGTMIPAGEVLRCSSCRRPPRMTSGDEIVLERLEMEIP